MPSTVGKCCQLSGVYYVQQCCILRRSSSWVGDSGIVSPLDPFISAKVIPLYFVVLFALQRGGNAITRAVISAAAEKTNICVDGAARLIAAGLANSSPRILLGIWLEVFHVFGSRNYY